MHLFGRTVLLTGAAGGIGGHIADALARHGARLVLSDRDEASLERVAHRGVRVAADLADPAQAEALVPRAEEAAGPLDVLVNCAGVEYTGAFAEQTRAEMGSIVAINLLAPMLLTKAALPGMLERRCGHIVNIASISGLGPAPFLASYGTTKAGLIELTRSLRVEYRGSGVRFSVISPGFVERDGMYARMAQGGLKAPIAIGTVAPERVARAVVDAVQDGVPEKIVAARPMRPFFVLTELYPPIGDAGILASGARRFLQRVGRQRGRA